SRAASACSRTGRATDRFGSMPTLLATVGGGRSTRSPRPGRRTSASGSASGASVASVPPLSSRRGRRFLPALRRISDELTLPEPAKSRVVLEMAADLVSLYEHHRARGRGEEEAAQLAEETILASPEALRHLVLLHTTGHARWLGWAAGRLRRGVEVT